MIGDPVAAFCDEARERRGLLLHPGDVKADGQIHRCDVDAPGHSGRGDGAYKLYLDERPAGGFQNHQDGIGWENWRADLPQMSPAEAMARRAKMDAEREQRAREQARREAEQRERIKQILEAAEPAADHEYAKRKGVSIEGRKVRIHRGELTIADMQCNGALMVPMYALPAPDAKPEIRALQFIGAGGDKRFMGSIGGCFFPIGKPEGKALICEGLSTGLSLHECTGLPVVVAFTAGNLLAVGQLMRARYGDDLALIYCADDDWKTKRNGEPCNPGIEAATAAALATGGLVARPIFPADRGDKETDFNDSHTRLGAEAVRRAVEDAEAPSISEAQPALENRPGAILTGRVGKWDSPGEITAPLQPVPAFDPDALLPDGLRAWVMDEADRMPAPPDFVALPAIVALGSVIGTQCAAKPKSRDDWVVTANLWGASVGGPSTKKSPALSAALKPLDKLIAKAIEKHNAEMSVYETAKTVSEARRDAIKERLKKAAKEGSGEMTTIADELTQHQARAEAEGEPRLRRYKSNDSTVEKTGELLRDNPNGILMLRDEVVGLIASWDREGREGDRAFYLEAWNGTGSFDTDRIGRGTIFIPNLCISIYGGIQPDKLTAYLEEASDSLANDGMLQRFQMIAFPDERPWKWADRIPIKDARERVGRIFERLSELPAVEWGASPADDFVRFPFMRFDDEAQALFIEWTGELHRRIPQEHDPLVAQHLAKFDKLFPALALVFHLIDCADKGLRGPITRESALRAAAWCQYLEAHARRCYGLLADKGLRAAQALAQMVGGGHLADGFTARDVRRKQRRHLKSDEAVQAALEWLLDEGWMRGEEVGGDGPGSGRKTVRYHINPRIARRASND